MSTVENSNNDWQRSSSSMGNFSIPNIEQSSKTSFKDLETEESRVNGENNNISPMSEENSHKRFKRADLPEKEKEKPTFPAKPCASGTLGRLIRLRTNHYGIKVNRPFKVYQYDVEVSKMWNRKGNTNQSSPNANSAIVVKKEEKKITSRALMRLMFQVLIEKLPPHYRHKIIYDFGKNLFSLIQLPFEESVSFFELILKRNKCFS